MNFAARRRLRRRLCATSTRDRRLRVGDDLIGSLVHVHRLVVSGSSLQSAITHAGRAHSCSAIDSLRTRLIDGEPLDIACRNVVHAFSLKKRPTIVEKDSLIALHVLSVASSIGGRTSEQLESLIDDLGERERVRRERRTQAASSLASMRLMTWLPIVCGAWILLDSKAIRGFVFGTPAGWICLALGIGSNILGRLWLHRAVTTC